MVLAAMMVIPSPAEAARGARPSVTGRQATDLTIAAPQPGTPTWRWPLSPAPQVLRPFAPPAHPWEAGHRGVDLAAKPGQPVYAAGPGRVGYAHDLAGRGVVTVIHGALRTTYLPVRATVRVGRHVAAGDRIGVVEAILGHCGQTACLHWGLRQGIDYLDPLILLGQGPVRLLPWWDPRTPTPPDANAASIHRVSTSSPRNPSGPPSTSSPP